MKAEPAGLGLVLKKGMAAPLGPLGFTPTRSRRTWMRETGELVHVVGLWKRRESFVVQWGIVCPELVGVMWDVPYKAFDVAQSIVTGTPSSIRHPARAESFRVAALESGADEIAAGVLEDMAVVTAWMEPLATRRALRVYLLANREATDRRAFVVPSKRPLKLFTAAGLAIVDRDPTGCQLLVEAEAAFGHTSGEDPRFARLKDLAGDLCGC